MRGRHLARMAMLAPRTMRSAALELRAVPIIAAVCARSWEGRPVNRFVVRKAIKDHGTERKIDGNFKDTNVVLFAGVLIALWRYVS